MHKRCLVTASLELSPGFPLVSIHHCCAASPRLGVVPIDQILVPATNDQLHDTMWLDTQQGLLSLSVKIVQTSLKLSDTQHLPRYSNLVIMIKPNRTVLLVLIIEDYRHCCFCNPSLALLVDQLLQAACPHL